MRCLSALATDPARELDVLWHDGHPLGVDGAQVGISKVPPDTLRGLLEGLDGGRLEAQVGLEVLGNLPDQALERQLANQKLGAFVPADLPEGDARAVPVLDAAGGRRSCGRPWWRAACEVPLPWWTCVQSAWYVP